MHYLRFASLLVGAWLAGSLFLMGEGRVAVGSATDLIRGPHPAAAKTLSRIEPKGAELLLKHQSLETGRRLRGYWQFAQILLGAGVLLCLFLAPGSRRYSMLLCVLMLGCVLFLHFFLLPEMRKLTPAADFVQDTEESLSRDRLRSLQTGYTIIDSVKLGLGFVLAVALIRSSNRRRRTPIEDV